MFTITGWITFIFLTACVIGISAYILIECDLTPTGKLILVIVAILLCAAIFGCHYWYFTATASGQRAVTDERSNFNNGLERTVTIYTADGTIIAQYSGKIDLEMDQDYIKFDWKGKRYIYYNCFVETIADIP